MFLIVKKWIVTLGLLLLAITAKADTGFVKSLSAEDFAAAGLQKLTPEELARLEALVQRHATGEMAVVRQQEEAKASDSRSETDKKEIASKTEARNAGAKADETETKATVVPAKKQPRWFTALLTLNRAKEKPEKEEPLESRLVGDFNGWNGRSIFKLENGTRWVQQNKTETYIYSPVLHSPKVKITPASITGFWLEIEGVNLCVRVIPLELPDQK
jgi:hypothetical protein